MSEIRNLIYQTFNEQGKNSFDLVTNGVLSKHTFYHLKNHVPSLKNLLKIVNYLEVSIDYLFELTEDNFFSKYKPEQNNFYINLISILKEYKISQRQFCRDLNYSVGHLWRWKRGGNPNVITLIEIMKYLNCSSYNLLDKEK